MYDWNMQKARDAAEFQGCKVVDGDAEHLLLDIDGDADLKQYSELMSMFRKKLGVRELCRWRSKSGIGWHVVLSCPVMPARERVMLQACLGSDRKRAILGLLMIADGIEEPNMLFRPAQK